MSKRILIQNEVIEAIKEFFEANPYIRKDCDIYPDEQGLYQAHSIANYISMNTGLNRCLVLIAIENSCEYLIVKNRKLKTGTEIEIYKTRYYYGGNTTPVQAKVIRGNYELASTKKTKIVFT